MATLTIKNIPEPLVKRLKQQAAAHRRSVNFEVISCPERMTHNGPLDADVLLARAQAVCRTSRGIRLTDRLLHDLKITGRSRLGWIRSFRKVVLRVVHEP